MSEDSQYVPQPWDDVNHFKVNKWMLKLGAVWTASEEEKAIGAGGIGSQWEVFGMILSQTDAAKWYVLTHKSRWSRLWS